MSSLIPGQATPARPPVNPQAESISELLTRRGLPEARFERLWAVRGTQSCCESCGRVIAADEVEFELEYRHGSHSLTVVLHRDCWEELRQL